MTGNKSIAVLGTRGIPAKYGGFETFAEELSVRLVSYGVSVTVYCEKNQGISVSDYKGVKLVYVPSFNLGPFSTILFDVCSLWQAHRGYTVVYMLGYGAAWACFLPRFWGSKVWLNVDGVEWARAKWGRVAKVYFRMMEFCSLWTPNRIIADAEGIKTHLVSRHKRIPPCSVIPYGAPIVATPPDVSLLEEWHLVPGQYYLVVARLEPENHILEIIEGYQLACSKMPLVIVGNHQSGTAYVHMLASRSGSMVKFLGGVYDKPTLQALRYFSRAYFHGHSVGGTNPSLLEGLGCGNLIVAHDNVYNREVVGDIGYYFRKSDEIPPIVAAIEALVVEARDNLGNQAKARILEKYDWDLITESYLQVLSEDS